MSSGSKLRENTTTQLTTMTEFNTSVQNRSEIYMMLDIVNANGNGNPLSPDNMPRIDPHTGHCYITDVRLKRFIRDQLVDDGESVYVKMFENEDGTTATRDDLLTDLIAEELDIEADEIDETTLDALLDNTIDIRYFGATMSFSGSNDHMEALEEHYGNPSIQGPVQFAPGQSLNAVQLNDEFAGLSTVIASGEGKGQGTFAQDNRIKYGMFAFNGIVNENVAETSRLTEEDVRKLDTLCWRAVKNQGLSRSKYGQEPQLYIRVEYDTDNFHIGRMNELFQVDENLSKDDLEMRSSADCVVAVDDFLTTLANNSHHVDSVNVHAGHLCHLSIDGEERSVEEFYDALRTAVGHDSVNVVDVYDSTE